MPTKRLYLQPLPSGAQLQDVDNLQANLSQQGLLSGDAAVEQLSQQPGDHVLQGQYRCKSPGFGEMMGRELRELGASDGFGAIPFYRTDSEAADDGYYVVERADEVGPVEPQEPAIQQFRLNLSADGTHETRWTGVETTPSQVDHEYGNDTTPRIAIPDTATKRRWYDSVTGTVEPVGTPLSVEPTEHGDVAIYDVDAGETAVGTDGGDRGPTLLYELSYSDAGVVDPVVWDGAGLGYGESYGEDYGGIAPKLDDDGDRQWQHVFSTSHEFGVPVLDSGRLRVYVRESVGDLVAETWDDANGTWNGVGLDWSTTDWQLFDADIEHASPATIRTQLTFTHPTDGLYALNAALHRGWNRLQFSVPANESAPIPTGLEDTVAPIASDQLVDPQPVRTLVRRSEVRR